MWQYITGTDLGLFVSSNILHGAFFSFFLSVLFLFFPFFPWLHLRHVEVSRLGLNQSCSWGLNHRHNNADPSCTACSNIRSLALMSEDRDQIPKLTDMILVGFITLWATMGTPSFGFLILVILFGKIFNSFLYYHYLLRIPLIYSGVLYNIASQQ